MLLEQNVFRAKALRANVVGANGRIANFMGRICVFIKKSLQFGPMSLEQTLQHCIQTIKVIYIRNIQYEICVLFNFCKNFPFLTDPNAKRGKILLQK
jgi:hypothetical protein